MLQLEAAAAKTFREKKTKRTAKSPRRLPKMKYSYSVVFIVLICHQVLSILAADDQNRTVLRNKRQAYRPGKLFSAALISMLAIKWCLQHAAFAFGCPYSVHSAAVCRSKSNLSNFDAKFCSLSKFESLKESLCATAFAA